MTEPTEPLSLNALDREYIFLHFGFVECARAKTALDEVSRLSSLRRVDECQGIEIREWISVFDHIRMALHFSASVSRIFFPPKSWDKAKTLLAKSRGERLRALTGIEKGHPIENRKLRDHVEHMDERMDAWTTFSPRPFGGAVEQIIYPDTFKITQDAIEASCPIIFYPASQTVVAFGEAFDLCELKGILEDVSVRLNVGREAYYAEKRERETGAH